MTISYYTSTPLSEVEGWTYEKWRRVLAHVAVIRQKEKEEALRERMKFAGMRP